MVLVRQFFCFLCVLVFNLLNVALKILEYVLDFGEDVLRKGSVVSDNMVDWIYRVFPELVEVTDEA